MVSGEYFIGECVLYSEDRLRDIVQYALSKNGLTIHRLSQVTGISDSTISSWLRGDHTIRYDKLEVLFCHLNERY